MPMKAGAVFVLNKAFRLSRGSSPPAIQLERGRGMAPRTNHRTAVHPELTQQRPRSQRPVRTEISGSATRVTGGRAQLEWDRSHGDP